MQKGLQLVTVFRSDEKAEKQPHGERNDNLELKYKKRLLASFCKSEERVKAC
jgi:hypothetical protein